MFLCPLLLVLFSFPKRSPAAAVSPCLCIAQIQRAVGVVIKAVSQRKRKNQSVVGVVMEAVNQRDQS